MPAAVLWVDPGGTTGVAWWSRPYGFSSFEGSLVAAGHQVATLCRSYSRGLAIGWERFDITPGIPQRDAKLAIEMIGVCRYWALSCGCQILTEAAPGDRDVATPPMLRKLGWYPRGEKDAISASQHLLAYMLRARLLDPPAMHKLFPADN